MINCRRVSPKSSFEKAQPKQRESSAGNFAAKDPSLVNQHATAATENSSKISPYQVHPTSINMLPKITISQLLFGLSLASLSICHIIRRDAIEETSVAMVTEELSSNELASFGNHPNNLPNEPEDAEDLQEETNELGNSLPDGYAEGNDFVEEEIGAETSTTSPGETTRDITTSHGSVPSTAAIETSTSNRTTEPTTSMEQLRMDALTDATAPAPEVLSTAASTDDEFSFPTEPCYEPPAQQLHLNFKQSNQNVKFPALAILKKESVEDDLLSDNAESDQPGDESASRREYVNMTCPNELLHVTGVKDVNRRSLCPWTYVADVDPNRYPSKIMFAVCRCPECILAGGGGGDGFSADNTCRQVHFRMKVLRKGSCVNGLYVYNTEYQDIPVACACVRPKI